MFKEAINRTIATAAAALLLAACTDADRQAATDMLSQAQALYDSHQYIAAKAAIDSLNARYPAQTEVRRQGMLVWARADERVCIDSVAVADSIIAVKLPIVEEIARDFVVVNDPDLVENYRIYKTLKGNPLTGRTGIEPRVTDNGSIYLMTLLQGRAIEHTHLRVTSPAGSAQTAVVPHDGAQNYRYTVDGVKYEMITFHADQCEEFCQFIADNAASAKQLKLEFVGRSTYRVAMSPTLVEAITRSFQYSQAIKEGLAAERMKLYYTRRIELAKKQQM